MINRYDILIVGAGHGGAQAAAALRQYKFSGTIAVIGEEPEIPYERPPLSKDYLAQDKPFESILIRPSAYWQEREIAMLTNRRVVAVDPDGHKVTIGDGEMIGYGQLIWAGGGYARKLTCPGHDLAGVHSIRTRADVDLLISELPATGRIAVIGGGYTGLETAAVLAKLGKQVTVLEAQDRVLARVAGETLSRFFEAEHRAHGIDVRLNTTVTCIQEKNSRAAGVCLANGDVLPAELIIVAIGIIPAVEPLRAAGAASSNGVAVDGQGRTSLPDVWAIGDCALHPNAFADGQMIRLESVQNANDMAIIVAKAIVGEAESYKAVPWFWSNQFDLRLQTIGLSTAHDAAVTRGDVAGRSFSIIYLKQGHIVALDSINCTRDYVQGRALVLARAKIDPALLADVSRPLKELMSLGPRAAPNK